MADRLNTRELLLEAAFDFIPSAAGLPGVQRIAIIGSIMTQRLHPKDIDLLVYVGDGVDLESLAALARRLQGRLQGQSRGADVFLADTNGLYLGRTCPWKLCKAGIRASCDALHCGRRPYLHDDLNTVLLRESITAAPPLDVWPQVVRRCDVPADVERFIARLGGPHNHALQRTHSRGTTRANTKQAARHAARR